MPVRRIASIKAMCEMQKRKFVSPCFSSNEGRLVYWLQRTMATRAKEDQARKADCCQRVAAQQLRAVIRQLAKSTGR
jgi:hypothetical protein